MNFLSIAGYSDLQHYKHRNPPWIKLHLDLLDADNVLYACLQDASKLLYIHLCLLASRHENKIPLNNDWLKRRLNISSKIDFSELVSSGLIEMHEDCKRDASAMLADCKRDAMPETETETETEKRQRENAATPSPPALRPPRKARDPDKPKPVPADPLGKYEPLADCFTEFIQQVAGRYPSARLPGSGTADWFKWRRDLADLHVLDGFTVQHIGEVLEWLWRSPDRNADFWRGNVQSIPALRKRKTGDALSKFGKIHAAWQGSKPISQKKDYGPDIFSGDDDDETEDLKPIVKPKKKWEYDDDPKPLAHTGKKYDDEMEDLDPSWQNAKPVVSKFSTDATPA